MSSQPDPPEKRPRRRRKASAGGAFLGLLLAAGLVFVWYGTELGWSELLNKVFQPEEETEEPWTRPTGGRVVEGEAFDYTPAWEQDERWERAWEKGERGSKLLKEAVDRHYNSESGDPFRFRAETDEATGLLRDALADFEAMEQDFAGDPAAVLEIGKVKRRYEGLLADQGPKRR